MSFSLIATIHVKEGKMEEAKEVLKELVPTVRASEAGLLAYIPHTVKDQENTIIWYEKYKDGDAMKVHMANLGKNMAKLNPLLDKGMDIKTLFEIV
jgi:quinol monooxygenase YgiN